jgi:hypothetical protein
MALTDLEREEFKELTKHSYDPELWLDDDLPLLRELKRQRDQEQRWHGLFLIPPRNPLLMEDEEGTSRDWRTGDE